MGYSFVYNSGSYQEKEEEVLHLQFGLFFDGTANNLYNTDARKYKNFMMTSIELNEQQRREKERIKKSYFQNQKDKEKKLKEEKVYEEDDFYEKYFLDDLWGKGYGSDVSYQNDHTNVARMYLNADRKKYAIYIEGVGTRDLEDDISYPGISHADGITGILPKVKKGSEELAKRINRSFGKKKKSEERRKIKKIKKITLTLDVFGFSRGAAAARYFIYQISRNKHLLVEKSLFRETSYKEKEQSYLRIALNRLGLGELVSEINIRFVGIYDTVASYNPRNMDTYTDFEKYIHLLHLDDISRAKFVVHFTALDEIRKYFSLTRLPPFLGIEKNLPGAHSDVGGSYDCDTNHYEYIQITKGKVEGLRKKMIKEGWYQEKEIRFESRTGNILGGRTLKGEYCYLPLQWMIRYASFLIENDCIDYDNIRKTYVIRDTLLRNVKKYLEDTTFRELSKMPEGIKSTGDLNRFIAHDRIVKEDWTFESGKEQELLKELRHKYLHQSAYYDFMVSPHAPNENRKRREF